LLRWSCNNQLQFRGFNSDSHIMLGPYYLHRNTTVTTVPPYHHTKNTRTNYGQLWRRIFAAGTSNKSREPYLPMAALVSMFSLYNKNEMKLGWLTGQASWVPRLSNTPSRFLSRSPRSPPSSSRPRLRLPPFFPFAFTRTRMHFPSLPEKQQGARENR
jgi:hypothetical protein